MMIAIECVAQTLKDELESKKRSKEIEQMLQEDKEKLERVEKNVAGRSVDFLATLYQYKRDKVRGKDQKAYDALDAKFNEFDKLHDKYNN